MRARRATVRLQLHARFTLDDAREQVPYYEAMGISHFYLSPISSAVSGSSHGYDVTDPGCVNPELGGEPALRKLSDALHARNMGILLDIVPNHMATHATNRWWWDVLAHGQQSRYASWLDIDWRPADKTMYGKVLAPFLEHDYAESLQRGDLRLSHDDEAGRYVIQASGSQFPVADGTLASMGRDPAAVLADYDPSVSVGIWRLHELLKRQHYRLCGWRCAADSINWRRFFEISGLIGVRVEEPEVFDAVHKLPLRLYEEGVVDGLRIDHVDGLAQPLSYCTQLRAAMRACKAQGPFGNAEPWLVVEKILAAEETLDHRWQVDGTTGYDFMDQVAAVLQDPHGAERLVELWREISGWQQSATSFVHEARLLMLRHHFVAEKNALARSLQHLLATSAGSNTWSQQKVARVLELFFAEFPVYRTYLPNINSESQNNATLNLPASDVEVAAQDIVFIEQAAARARTQLASDSDELGLLDHIVNTLIGTVPTANAPAVIRNEAVRRFQQLTPPLAAKSLEDTVFYRYAPLLSRNEVGSEPNVLARTVDQFHACNTLRVSRFTASLLATATHDHKRGEDARARMAVLGESPDAWKQACQRWLEWSSSQMAPQTPSGRAERYMLWQALAGAWPLNLNIHDADAVARFALRIKQWLRKALREAKLNSSWFVPDLDYETASIQYLYELLGWAPQAAHDLASMPDDDEPVLLIRNGHNHQAGLLQSFHAFVQGIAPAGVVNSLVQTVLRLTSPGVPDMYQGTECSDYSLVDPDNRRAVDYEQRGLALSLTGPDADMAGLLKAWRDGRVKQAVIRRVLALRIEWPEVFSQGDYVPLKASGPRSDHVIAFMRCLHDRLIVVVVPRLCAAIVDEDAGGGLQTDMTYWQDTSIMVPAKQGLSMQNVFTGEMYHLSENNCLSVRDLFAGFPCAVLASA